MNEIDQIKKNAGLQEAAGDPIYAVREAGTDNLLGKTNVFGFRPASASTSLYQRKEKAIENAKFWGDERNIKTEIVEITFQIR